MEDTASLDTGSPPADFLTPRSKVAKMLADIDDEPTPSPSQREVFNPIETPAAAQRASEAASGRSESPASVQQKSAFETVHDNDIAQTESDDSEDDVRRPQGRAARRMLGLQGRQNSPGSSPRNGSSPPRPVNLARGEEVRIVHGDEEEDDLYSVTPMKSREATQATIASPTSSIKGNGLFVSPAKSNDNSDDSEEDLPSNPLGSKEKLAELVAQKRAERLAREAEEKQQKKQTSAQASPDLPEEAFEGSQDPVDPNIERIMSDASRPARKASKKALLDMERETQRLARQQALAHQMKVKKKFTTSDLFAKFNFRQPAQAANDQMPEGYTTASSATNSVGVEERPKEPVSTPPSSPPTPLDRQKALVDQGALSKVVPVREDSIASLAEMLDDDQEELPDIREVLEASQMRRTMPAVQTERAQPEKKGLKVARFGKKVATRQEDGSDDDLDIIPSLPAHLRAFEKATGYTRASKAGDSKAIYNLKHLSHLHYNDSAPRQKKGSRPSINPQNLEDQLRRRAKEQTRQQQLERIEELKAKGVEVQTTEEREQEAEAFENLLEKARVDAVELRKAEKAAAKEGAGVGEVSDDEDEDEEYVASGSEDEEMEEGGGLIDGAAEETDEEDEDDEEGDVEEQAEDADVDVENEPNDGEPPASARMSKLDFNTPDPTIRKPRKSRIVFEDDDEFETPSANVPSTAEAIEEEEDDPFAAFNFGAKGDANSLLSPTQAFNATMQTTSQATQEDSFDILRRIAPPSTSSLPPSLPDFDSQTQDEDTQLSFVAGSQVAESRRISLDWETQQPETPVPAGLDRGPSALSETPGWEPSQDLGFQSPWSVRAKGRLEPAIDEDDDGTQSTVQLRVSESPASSLQAPRRGKLGRRKAVAPDDSDEEETAPVASVRPENRDAFREMARRRKEALTATERADAENEMRGMMDEQAEESDDEYAGLGGDDAVAAETEQDREMIDSSHIDVDERQIAAHYAERQRQRDEEETSKLYKDLTTGVLRRKMGANAFDLDEDEDEVAVRRRQLRQMEEAKKRRALLKDENIATLAEGKSSKGKDAFLKAIADDGGDDDIINISEDEEDSMPATQDESQQPSQSQTEALATEPLQEMSGNKRRLPGFEDEDQELPPAKQRRTQASAFKRPTSLLEVQESVSFLLDEPDAGAAAALTELDFSSDSEFGDQLDSPDAMSDDDDEVAAEQARLNEGGFAPNPKSMDAKIMPPPRLSASQRRTAPKPAVVDRLSLKRGSSASDSAHSRTAWAAGPTTGGFKVPSLLRRATTTIASGANDRGVTTPTLSRENSGAKMGGTKKSSLAYQARAEERRAIVEASAKRREENTAKIAQLRRDSSMLNRGLTGRFE